MASTSKRVMFSIALALFALSTSAISAEADSNCQCRRDIRERAAECLRNANATLFTDPMDTEAVKRAREQEKDSKKRNCESISSSEYTSCSSNPECK